MKKTLTSMAVAATMVAAPVMADLVYPSLSYQIGRAHV